LMNWKKWVSGGSVCWCWTISTCSNHTINIKTPLRHICGSNSKIWYHVSCSWVFYFLCFCLLGYFKINKYSIGSIAAQNVA
jgi:hypothetical protein